MNAKELREQSLTELNSSRSKLRREQFKLRLTKASGEITKTHRLKSLRRDIARINTIVTEKEAKAKKEAAK